jgi:hypothetical protein
MRIEERNTGEETSNLCEIVIETIRELRSKLETVIIESSVGASASKQLKTHMYNKLVVEGWRPQFKISKQVSAVYPLANFVLDAMRDFSSGNCMHTHRFFVEFCFDNRQAIGSNILKFEVASRIAHEASFQPVSVLICAETDALRYFGWDGSIASASEYEYALRAIYRDIVKFPPIILALHN